MRFSSLIVLSFLLLLATTNVMANSHTKYSFGVFPYNSARQLISLYGPVAKNINSTVDATLKLKTASSFYKFTRNLQREIYDIALIQPFDYPAAIDKYNYVPLARLDAPLSAFFVVMKDSKIKTLDDLRGKTIALPPPPAAISHLAIAELLDAKISPNIDVKISHQKSHNSCLHQVLIRDASACATDFVNIRALKQNKKLKFRVLQQTRQLPHILFVAHKRLPEHIIRKIKRKIIQWKNNNEGKKLLEKLGMPGFIDVADDDYQVMYTFKKPDEIKKKRSKTNGFNLGILPYIPAKKLATRISPIINAFSKALNNQQVHFRTATSYDQFHADIAQGVYDIVLIQPFDYIAATEQGYLPLAQISYDVQATIYINKGDNINVFEDLLGKTVASAPWHAATSRLFNEKIRRMGLWIGKDIFIDYKTSHYDCFDLLRKKQVAACVSGPLVLRSVPDELSKNVRLLEKSHAIPGILFMVHSRIKQSDRLKIKNEILNWHKHENGRKLLEHSKLKYFIEVETDRYEAMRNR